MIESVFGKLKRLEQDQAKSGFTGLLLCVSAMVSTTTEDVVQKALQTVPTKRFLHGAQKTLGNLFKQREKKPLYLTIKRNKNGINSVRCNGPFFHHPSADLFFVKRILIENVEAGYYTAASMLS